MTYIPERDREKQRAYQRENRDRRRAWDSEGRKRAMAEARYGTCEACGTPVSSYRKATKLCVECLRKADLRVAQQVTDLWLSGMVLKDISAATGRSPASIRIGFIRMRKCGIPVPRRAQGRWKDGEIRWIDPVPESITLKLGWAAGVHSMGERES